MRLLTGDRPTGKLHLGHYIGSIKNRISLQDKYECFFIIADIHTLTTKSTKEETIYLKEHILGLVADYIACGVDITKSTIFLQSKIKEIFELNTLLGMLVPFNKVNCLPSIKEMATHSNIKEDQLPIGLLNYPVLQTADILCFNSLLVPVGKDNEAHIELSRFIAKKFNRMYGDTFMIPKSLITIEKNLVGTDGKNKMSKSLNNAIYLSDDDASIRNKVKKMYTDPNRVSASTPGNTDNNPVFQYLYLFDKDISLIDEFAELYRHGKITDKKIKDRLADSLIDFITPIRKKRESLLKDPDYLIKILNDGSKKASKIASETLSLAKQNMNISF